MITHTTVQTDLKVPQYLNDIDCGLYAILFALELCHGHDPGRIDFHVTPQDIRDLRFKITVRFARESPALIADIQPSVSVPPSPSPSVITEITSKIASPPADILDTPSTVPPPKLLRAPLPVAILTDKEKLADANREALASSAP
jgi:hypothetical protein